MQQGMTIGRLAKAAGVNVETIRYYQRRGLISEPSKPQGGHRRYPPGAMARIAFIRRAQQLGFSLAEVKDLLQHSDGRDHRETRRIAERKHATLDLHIAQLTRMRKRLKALIQRSLKADGKGACPIIAALLGEG
ncbi:MAG TPA: MerR family transcriptional regulator [Usitatibacter sp.]|nr:MerR family transcriptional regulator [Usitatibacter sp.]